MATMKEFMYTAKRIAKAAEDRFNELIDPEDVGWYTFSYAYKGESQITGYYNFLFRAKLWATVGSPDHLLQPKQLMSFSSRLVKDKDAATRFGRMLGESLATRYKKM